MHSNNLSPGRLHLRNRHQGRYDFAELIRASPELVAFVVSTPSNAASIDFANPQAVRALNRALLKHFYNIEFWDIPAHYLCPPIPARADYVHTLADLLASSYAGSVGRSAWVQVLDVGVGANCIYPLLGHREYGWHFIGVDIDPRGIACAQAILRANHGLDKVVKLRLQNQPSAIFSGIWHADEMFDLVMCNPPFHTSLAQATLGTRRKWRNLGKDFHDSKGNKADKKMRDSEIPHLPPALNFGGQGAELWCPGGEGAFIGRMINESKLLRNRCLWFTALVSKAASLPGLEQSLRAAGVVEQRIVEMTQGQKNSRVLAWTYLTETQRHVWCLKRSGNTSAPERSRG